MKELTKREIEIASVAADLLLKGSPEYRIAQYCLRKNMTKQQVHKFVYNQKLDLPGELRQWIYDKFCRMVDGHKNDDAYIDFGNRLKKSL